MNKKEFVIGGLMALSGVVTDVSAQSLESDSLKNEFISQVESFNDRLTKISDTVLDEYGKWYTNDGSIMMGVMGCDSIGESDTVYKNGYKIETYAMAQTVGKMIMVDSTQKKWDLYPSALKNVFSHEFFHILPRLKKIFDNEKMSFIESFHGLKVYLKDGTVWDKLEEAAAVCFAFDMAKKRGEAFTDFSPSYMRTAKTLQFFIDKKVFTVDEMQLATQNSDVAFIAGRIFGVMPIDNNLEALVENLQKIIDLVWIGDISSKQGVEILLKVRKAYQNPKFQLKPSSTEN